MVLTNHLIYLVNVKTKRIFFSNNVCFLKILNSTRKNQFKCHNLVFWLNNIPHNVGLLTNQWAAQINLVYKLVYASLFFFSFPHEPHENPNLCIIFFYLAGHGSELQGAILEAGFVDKLQKSSCTVVCLTLF